MEIILWVVGFWTVIAIPAGFWMARGINKALKRMDGWYE